MLRSNTTEQNSSVKYNPFIFQTHTLEAILLLLRDLDEEELHIVHTATHNKLSSYALNNETLMDSQMAETLTNSLHTEKAADIEH